MAITKTEERQRVVDETKAVFDHLYSLLTPHEPVEYSAKQLGVDTGLGTETIWNRSESRAATLQQIGILARHINYGRHDPEAPGGWKVGRWAAWELLMSEAEAQAVFDEWAANYMSGAIKNANLRNAAKEKAPMPKDMTKFRNQPSIAPGGPITRTSVATIEPEFGMGPNGITRINTGIAATDAETVIAADTRPDAPTPLPVTNKSGTNHGNYKPREDASPTYAQKGTQTHSGEPGRPIPADTVAVAATPDEEVRAIAGPDRPSPFAALAPLRKASDADALIAAARQYAARTDTIQAQVDGLAKMAQTLGITVDTSAVMGAIDLTRDERLETIALVLPVIDRLEATNTKLVQQVESLKDKARQTETLGNENRRMKARIEQLISERVMAAQRVQ